MVQVICFLVRDNIHIPYNKLTENHETQSFQRIFKHLGSHNNSILFKPSGFNHIGSFFISSCKKVSTLPINFGLQNGAGPVRFYWYTSTLGLTLDTVSIIVTQYNNTAITKTTTIHGDVNSLDVNSITTAIDVASVFLGENEEYVSSSGCSL